MVMLLAVTMLEQVQWKIMMLREVGIKGTGPTDKDRWIRNPALVVNTGANGHKTVQQGDLFMATTHTASHESRIRSNILDTYDHLQVI
jgi:hypothetical protein